MSAKAIRDLIIETITSGKSSATAELNGNYFSGTDIAVADIDGDVKTYRIIVISHKPETL